MPLRSIVKMALRAHRAQPHRAVTSLVVNQQRFSSRLARLRDVLSREDVERSQLRHTQAILRDSGDASKAVDQFQTNQSPLVDSFGRQHTYLRVSLTERCNLRCTYCMPAAGIELTNTPNLLTTKEFMVLCELFVKLGINKIRLTGGEPTVRKDIVHIVQSLKSIPGLQTVAMTTNGVLLDRSKLDSLRAAGLTHLNISLDTLDRKKFETISRRPAVYHDRVMAAIRNAVDTGFHPLKINCVLMKGVNETELVDFVRLTQRDERIHVRFIELMPFAGNDWTESRFLSHKDALRIIQQSIPECPPMERWPLMHGDTAHTIRLPGFAGSFGFITTMTDLFCGSCSRLRLTADGFLKTCLHGQDETDLKTLLRNQDYDGLVNAIAASVWRKGAKLGGNETVEELVKSKQTDARPMIRIGG